MGFVWENEVKTHRSKNAMNCSKTTLNALHYIMGSSTNDIHFFN